MSPNHSIKIISLNPQDRRTRVWHIVRHMAAKKKKKETSPLTTQNDRSAHQTPVSHPPFLEHRLSWRSGGVIAVRRSTPPLTPRRRTWKGAANGTYILEAEYPTRMKAAESFIVHGLTSRSRRRPSNLLVRGPRTCAHARPLLSAGWMNHLLRLREDGRPGSGSGSQSAGERKGTDGRRSHENNTARSWSGRIRSLLARRGTRSFFLFMDRGPCGIARMMYMYTRVAHEQATVCFFIRISRLCIYVIALDTSLNRCADRTRGGWIDCARIL